MNAITSAAILIAATLSLLPLVHAQDMPLPKLLQGIARQTGVDLELRDDPMMRLDEFRLMSRPTGRDVTEIYAVA